MTSDLGKMEWLLPLANARCDTKSFVQAPLAQLLAPVSW
jgi:hypothetical protein